MTDLELVGKFWPHSRTIKIRSGGILSVGGEFNLFTFGPSERRLLQAIIAALDAYETEAKPPTPEQLIQEIRGQK